MDNSLFIEVKEGVAQWIKEKEKESSSKNIAIEIVDDSQERLYVIINFGECMAAIIVAKPDFAPYRLISFELAAMVNGIPTIPYSFYDKEGDTIEMIIESLDKAINASVG